MMQMSKTRDASYGSQPCGLIVSAVAAALACGAAALANGSTEAPVATIDWAALHAQGKLAAGTVEENAADGEAILAVHNESDAAATIHLAALEAPEIGQRAFALAGLVRHEPITGVGHFEMLVSYNDGGPYFSRTLGGGMMRPLSGRSGWREFRTPFQVDSLAQKPTRVDLGVLLPAGARIELGPVRLIEAASVATLLEQPGAWWSERDAGYVGGIGGALLGVCGGLIGLLAGTGRSKWVVQVLCVGMASVGCVALLAGVVALASSQPYAVWYPLLLGGALGSVLPMTLWPTLKRRYAEQELRQMRALDA